MTTQAVIFLPDNKTVKVPSGTLISEAAQQAGLEVLQPCGGQGRCGRCAVIVEGSGVRRRSTIRLSPEDVQSGYALACQTVIEADITVTIPEQERVERRLVTGRSARKVELPFAYDPALLQTVRALQVKMPQPSLDDNLDDLGRLKHSLVEAGITSLDTPLPVLRTMGDALRQSDWAPWVVLEEIGEADSGEARLLAVHSEPVKPLGLAIDIGTTTITVYLVDLSTGEVLSTAAEYNGQIAFGEDVISRIVFASKDDGLIQLSKRVRETIHTLLSRTLKRTKLAKDQIFKVMVAGNTTMIHLFLALPPASIRLTPYIPTVNQVPRFLAGELDLQVHPLASVDCLPCVASYVGADITAGALSSGLVDTDQLTLFIDVGTNGEIVLGTRDWMVTCACSAGPAFEGAGVVDGMRATKGAIEEVWVHSETFEPTYRVIGGGRPRGICGSGLISLMAELFVTGVVDRSGSVKLDLGTPRTRLGEHGPEYVVACADETETGKDIVLTNVDIENLMRAKAAIYAGYTVLAKSVGLELAEVQKFLIGGSFGQYVNVEKAIQIGLLPDMPWERFEFLGNTAIKGTYMALLSKQARALVEKIAQGMTYIELSADNTFFDAFTAASFMPHTDIRRFPSVAEIWERHHSQHDESPAT
ncbi:MAG: ASKHA domain-containing protein [Anaerolineales bacterium]